MKSNPREMRNHESMLLRPARAGELVATTIVACLSAGFYGAHLAWSTGFFTSEFTPVLASFFFISIFWMVINVASKAVTQRKGILALVEWTGTALFAGVTALLYVVFPFNFSHVADVVPAQLQFPFIWITNDIGKVLVGLILVASIIALAVSTIKLLWRLVVEPMTRSLAASNTGSRPDY